MNHLIAPDLFACRVQSQSGKVIAASVGSIPIACCLPDSDERAVFCHGYPAELVNPGGAVLTIGKRGKIGVEQIGFA